MITCRYSPPRSPEDPDLQWERDRIEVVGLNENDPNNIGEYRVSIDAAETRLIEDVRELAETLQAGHRYHLKLGVLNSDLRLSVAWDASRLPC